MARLLIELEIDWSWRFLPFPSIFLPSFLSFFLFFLSFLL